MTRKKSHRRGSSGVWDLDRLTQEEEQQYLDAHGSSEANAGPSESNAGPSAMSESKRQIEAEEDQMAIDNSLRTAAEEGGSDL